MPKKPLIPERYADASLADFDAARFRTGEGLVDLGWLNTAEDYGDGVALFGPVGVGKTRLAAALLRRDFEAGRREPRFVRWVKTATLLYELIHLTREAKTEILAGVKGCGLLVLDDIGAEKPSEWSQSMLLMVLDERLDWQKPTIVTSNLQSDELKANDPRLWDRVRSFHTVVMTGGSRR